jgi:hypothetical protein
MLSIRATRLGFLPSLDVEDCGLACLGFKVAVIESKVELSR